MMYYVQTKTNWTHGSRPWEVQHSTHSLNEAINKAKDLLMRGYDVMINQKEEQ